MKKTAAIPFEKGKSSLRLLWRAGREVPGVVSQAVLPRYRFPRAANRLLDGVASASPVPAEAYEDLFRYFAQGWVTYKTTSGAGAGYPGLPSWGGVQVEQLEGFARIMPLFGAWYRSGRSPEVGLPGGRRVGLADEFRRGLVAGTDPASDSYWGDMPGKSNQRIVEAADIALALWLFRDAVWPPLSEGEREHVVRWLAQVEERPGLDNNWHLFFVLISRVLAALGHPDQVPSARRRYERLKTFHLGDGWFKDGPDGKVDFYNAWGFHYALYWIDRIDPDWDPSFIRSCQRDFLSTYRYLIGPEGFPILGRSVCYRMAAAAPLVFGQELHPEVVSTGEARRALDAVWRHFVRQGAVRHGAVMQGYHGPNARVLDPYSGPASCLWSLRSLVVAFQYPRDDAFWQSEGEPLPVERGDYDVLIEGPRWRVRGERAARRITLDVLDNAPDSAPALEPFTLLQRVRSLVYGPHHRPANEAAKYGRRTYRSDQPFCS